MKILPQKLGAGPPKLDLPTRVTVSQSKNVLGLVESGHTKLGPSPDFLIAAIHEFLQSSHTRHYAVQNQPEVTN